MLTNHSYLIENVSCIIYYYRYVLYISQHYKKKFSFPGRYTFVNMEDVNINFCWNFAQLPAGSSLWIPLAGRLTSFGQSRYHSFPDYFCPHVIIGGRGIIEVNGERAEVSRGDMFTLWPGSEILYHDYPESPWRFYYFHMTGKDMKAYVQSLGFTRLRPFMRPEKPEEVIALFNNIWQGMRDRRPGGQYEILSQMFALPRLCGTPAEENNEADTMIDHALALINSSRNPAATNVNELCERLNVSRVTLYRRFIAQLHKTPIEYIITYRLKIACDLLTLTKKNTGEIAVMAGFNSEKYFFKVFRKRFGITPSEYRLQQKKKN